MDTSTETRQIAQEAAASIKEFDLLNLIHLMFFHSRLTQITKS